MEVIFGDDVDIVVKRDIRYLWEIKLDGYAIAGCHYDYMDGLHDDTGFYGKAIYSDCKNNIILLAVSSNNSLREIKIQLISLGLIEGKNWFDGNKIFMYDMNGAKNE